MKIDRWTLSNDGNCERCQKPSRMVLSHKGEMVLYADVERLQEDYDRVSEALTPKPIVQSGDGTCKWHYYKPMKIWQTDCNADHEFGHGGPYENQFTFCPYCGGNIEI